MLSKTKSETEGVVVVGGGKVAGAGGNSHMKKLDLPFGKREDQSLYDPRNTPF